MILSVKNSFYILLLLAVPVTTTVVAQTISPIKLVFSKICAGSFNGFDATFNHFGFPTGTTFEVQLSDPTGSFDSPIATTIETTTTVSASQKRIRFAVPVTLIGSENYKLRVKSSTGIVSLPFLTAASTTSFAAHYKVFENSFSINNKELTATLCSGATLSIAIDNLTPDKPSSSPANYSGLKYRWYLNNALISGANTSALLVTAAGSYYAELDFGSCSDANFSSNRVRITPATNTVATLSSSQGNPFCAANSTTVLQTEKGNSHQWFKESIAIAGATNPTFETNQAGNYAVNVNFGGCTATATIDLKAVTITGTLDPTSPILIAPSSTTTVRVSTEVPNPIYSWYRNNSPIASATSSSIELTEAGNYKVKLLHPSCPVTDEISFEVRFLSDPNSTEIPNLISPNNDGFNDSWQLPQEFTAGNDVEVVLLSPIGEEVLRTKQYNNNWPETGSILKNGYSVYYYIISSPNSTVHKGSITIVK